MKRKMIVILLATTLPLTAVSLPARAQFGSGIVFDPTNYAQNLLQAARALEQVNNQIQQLQNEASMLTNMGKNLTSLNVSELTSMVGALSQISNLMNQANGIAFNVTATANAWTKSFPPSYPAGTTTNTLATDAQSRWQQAMAAFQQTLQVQAQVAQNVQADTNTLESLVTASQGAVGNLQVTQATNQLLALSTKQQLQIQNLMAAQYRASTLDTARSAQDNAESSAAFTQFIGTGQAYSQ